MLIYELSRLAHVAKVFTDADKNVKIIHMDNKVFKQFSPESSEKGVDVRLNEGEEYELMIKNNRVALVLNRDNNEASLPPEYLQAITDPIKRERLLNSLKQEVAATLVININGLLINLCLEKLNGTQIIAAGDSNPIARFTYKLDKDPNTKAIVLNGNLEVLKPDHYPFEPDGQPNSSSIAA